MTAGLQPTWEIPKNDTSAPEPRVRHITGFGSDTRFIELLKAAKESADCALLPSQFGLLMM